VEEPDLNVRFRLLVHAARTYQIILEQGTNHWDHASWLESFQWINQPVEVPDKRKPSVDLEDYPTYGPQRREKYWGTVSPAAHTRRTKPSCAVSSSCRGRVIELLEGSWEKEPRTIG